MVQDRGGLDYRIDVSGNFQERLRQFRSDVDRARRSFRGFKNDVQSSRAASSDLARSSRQLADNLGRLSQAQTRAARSGRTQARVVSIQEAAARRLNREVRNEAIAQAEANLASQRGIQIRRRATRVTNEAAQAEKRFQDQLARLRIDRRVRQLQQQNREFRSLNAELGRTGNRANRVAFTFRRLFGILAAFTAARLAVRGFTELIGQAIRFNANIEQATLGVASLLTAVGRVSTATGEATEGAEALALAQGEARSQLAQLRVDATRTAATFDRLAETFQVAVAPGLTAGLNLDEIRNFTVQISQAAAAIGLPQNQLAEEIRSLLAGTIQARTTRIATSLGITNEQIRQAREAGVLAEFLNDRFQAFSQAGEEALGTFTVILTNLQDAFLQVLGSGSLEFFNEVKSLLTDIQDLLITEEDGVRLINPEAVAVVEAFFDGLDVSVEKARELVQELSLEDVAQTAEAIGRAISTAANIVSGFLSGLSQGLGDVTRVLNGLGNLGGQSRTLAEIVQLTARWGTVLLAIRTTVGLISPLLLPLRAIFSALGSGATFLLGRFNVLRSAAAALLLRFSGVLTVLRAIGARLVTVLVRLTPIGAGIAAAAFAAKQLLDEILGVELGLRDAARVVLVALKGGFQELVIEAKILGQELKDVFTFSDDAEQEISDTIDSLLREKSQLQQRINDEFSEILDKAALEGDITGALTDAVDTANEQTVLEPQVADEATEAVREIGGLYDDLPAIISEATRAFELQGDTVQSLEEDIRNARRAVQEAFATEGLGTAASGQVAAILEARNRVEDEGRDITAQRTQQEQNLANIRQQQLDLARQINDTGQLGAGFIAADLTAAQEILAFQAELRTNQNDLRLAEIQLQEARNTGRSEDAAALQARISGLNTEETALRDAIAQREALATQLREGVTEGLGEDAAQRLVELSRESISLFGQERVARENINTLAETQADLEEQINEIRDARLRASAVAATQEFQQSAANLQQELNLQLELNRVEQNRATRNFERRRVQTEARIAALVAERNAVVAVNEAEREAISSAIDTTDDLTTKLVLEEELAAKINQSSIQQQLFNAQIDNAKTKLEELNAIAERPITFGIGEAFREFSLTAEEQFTESFNIIRTALDGFVAEASQQIVDAFDPTVEQEDINARVARFLQGLANQILQFLIRLALSRAVQALLGGGEQEGQGQIRAAAALTTAASAFVPVIAGLNGAAANLQAAAAALTAANAVSAGTGAVTGGLIGKSHVKAKGFSTGGGIGGGFHGIRPRGLDPRDTQPIWAQPGEWMMKLKAVQTYGARAMAAINEGLVNPTALQALTGASNVSVRRPTGQGFQTGGLISRQRAQVLDANQPSAPSSSGRALVVGERQFDRMLAQGGLDSTMEGLEDRSAELNAILSVNRG